MKSNPLISIIIANYNTIKWLEKCISSIQEQNYTNYEIIVVDDVSTDKSVEYLQKNFQNIIIIKNLKNIGYGGANNRGASVAKGEYLLILNVDTYLNKDTLRKLSDVIHKNPEYDLMQMDVKNYDKTEPKTKYRYTGMDIFGYPLGSNTFFYADGCALVIKKSLYNKLHGFDESYFMYLEDIDLSWRARLLGSIVIFLKGINVYHYGGSTSVSTHSRGHEHATTFNRRFQTQKNNLRSLIKNYSLLTVLFTVPISCMLAFGEAWLFLLTGNFKGFVVLHKAVWWNVVHLPDTLQERMRIQKTRLLPDAEILKLCEKRLSKLDSFLAHGVPSLK